MQVIDKEAAVLMIAAYQGVGLTGYGSKSSGQQPLYQMA